MEFTGFPFLTAILLSCVAGLLVILILPEQRKAQIKWVSAVFSGITLILSLYLFIAYDKGQGGLQFVEKFSWVESIGISYLNAADGFNLPMLLLTGIVFFTGVLTMWELDYRVKEFFALYFLLVAGVFGLFMSMDLFFIFVWYDVSLFPMYLLIAIWGSTRKEYGAMKLTLYLLAGSALILPAIVYLFVQAGLNTFDVTILMRSGTFSPFEQKFAFIFLFWYPGRGMAVSHLVARGTCGCPHAREHGPRRCAYENRRFRRIAGGHFSVSGRVAVLGTPHGGAGCYRYCLWRLCRIESDRPEILYRLLERLPHGDCRSRAGYRLAGWFKWCGFSDVCPRYHDSLIFFGNRIYLRPNPYQNDR
jgi:hypothetical protein